MAKFTKYNENLDITGRIQTSGSSATTINSFAFGENVTASGNATAALGKLTVASGNYSLAAGQNSTASGLNSFVFGSGSTASGTNTIVFGNGIVGNTANTVYVPHLNISLLNGGASVGTLGVDINGNVVTGVTTSDIYATAFTYNPGTYDLTITRNDNVTLTANVGLLATDINVTGGSYNINTGVVTFTNTTGGTFQVTGFTSGMTDTLVTGFTYNNNQLTIFNSNAVNYSTIINTMTGLTVNGNLNATTVSATTYLNLPVTTDVFVTGGTANNAAKTYTFTNITGGTFVVNALTDIVVTAGTYNASAGTATFTNSTGGTFSVTGYFTGATDVFVTGGTYSNGTASFINNTGGTFSVTGFTTGSTEVFVTGGTANNAAKTYTFTNITGGTFVVNALTDIVVTGGTYTNSTGTATFANSTGGTFNVTGFTTGSTEVFVTGGTYTSGSSFNNSSVLFTNSTGGTFTVTGLTDVYSTGLTINNSTYDLTLFQNNGSSFIANLGILSTDIKVTGGTYDINTGVVTFTNSTGGTFNVSGFTSGMTDTRVTNYTYDNANTFTITDSTGGTFNASINVMTGLTVNGNLNATTVSATTYLNLPTDVFVSGGTLSTGGTATFTNTTGGTFSVSGFSTTSTSYWSASTGTDAIVVKNSHSLASGANALAEGFQTTASGSRSHAEGSSTTASGNFGSHAEGSGTIAQGQSSHAEGINTKAQGEGAHAEGFGTTAFGPYSHAGGFSSIASGDTSFVHGTNAYAGGVDTVVFGNGVSGSTGNLVYVPDLMLYNINGGVGIGGAATGYLGIDAAGIVTIAPSGGTVNKYAETVSLTGTSAYTITHNLGLDVSVDVKDLTNNERINVTIDNYTTTTVDITSVSDVTSARVIVIG